MGYFDVFFAKVRLKKQNLESVFGASEFGCPNRYTGLPKGLNTLLSVFLKNMTCSLQYQI